MSFTQKIIDGCTGCGTCISLCPQQAIKLIEVNGYFLAKRDEKLCNDCNRCKKVCPKITDNGYLLKNKPLSILKGFSKNSDIRYKSTSGGIVTGLLHAMMSQHEIDAVLLIRKKKDSGFIAYEPFWATTSAEIYTSSGSAYQPVPVNLILDKIKDYTKVAIVGLPCHIKGVRNYLYNKPKLKNRVVLTIGLTCSHNVSKLATRLIMEDSNIKHLEDLSYRGNGWPGGVTLVDSKQEYFFDNLNSLWHDLFGSFLLCPPYCLECDDDLAEFSDINVSDAWLKEELDKEDNPGVSIVSAWTVCGLDILARYQDFFQFEQTTFECLQQSQFYPLFFKKNIFSNRVSASSSCFYFLIRMINFFSFSIVFKTLPIKYKIKSIKFFRRLIYRALRYTKEGQHYFAP